jgi:hypothetical protein
MVRSSRISPILADVSFFRVLTEDHAGGGCVAVELALFVEEPRLGGGGAAADMDGGALAQEPSGLRFDRTKEVDLELDRGVSDARGEHRVYSAAHGGVEQGASETAVDGPDGIVVILGRHTLEDHPTFLDLVEAETQQVRHGGGR